jgi:hypothetical protein
MVKKFLDRPPFQWLDLSIDMPVMWICGHLLMVWPVVPPLLMVGRSEIVPICILCSNRSIFVLNGYPNVKMFFIIFQRIAL